MSKNRGASYGRKQRRGHIDMFGQPMRKRPFNNKKRTKGRKLQSDVQERYEAIMKRIKHLKVVAKKVKDSKEKVTEENWKEVFRKYDDHNLLYGPYEKDIMMQIIRS